MKRKVRVNISVDEKLLEDAKRKLDMFGGKLSTLFNSYLRDFVHSIDEDIEKYSGEYVKRIKDIEERVKKLEKLEKK